MKKSYEKLMMGIEYLDGSDCLTASGDYDGSDPYDNLGNDDGNIFG